MHLKVITPEHQPKFVVVVPTLETGSMGGTVISPRGAGYLEMMGAGIALSEIPEEAVDRVESDPDEKLPEFLELVEGSPGAVRLVNGAKGAIYDRLDEQNRPYNKQRLALGAFQEYVPFVEEA